ncbi:MAG: glycosyltransferase [Marmoricola sp.]
MVDVANSFPAGRPTAHGGVDVTVLVTTYLGHERLPVCLHSLASQTLDPARFEVLVVQNGPACPTPEVVAAFAAAHPALQVRVVEMARPGLGHARNVGLHAARGRHVTFVDDDDWVGPRYLEDLLGAAADGVVPVAHLGNVEFGADPDTAIPDYESYYGRRIASLEGRTVGLADVGPSPLIPALSVNAGKLAPLELARQVHYDECLRSGEDFVYWLALFALGPFRFRVLPRDPASTYFRTLRHGSLGRQQHGFDFSVLQRLDCIAAVNHVDRSRPAIARIAESMKTAQAEHVNRYLVRHPDEHGHVVAEARARGLYDLPWPVVNQGRAQDLAILYCFTPYLDTSGLVAARRLRERGVVTDVISQAMGDLRLRDPRSDLIAQEVVDQARVLPGAASFSNWSLIRDFVDGALATVEELEAEKGRPYRSVYSRAMAVASHFAAAALKIRQPGVRWEAEFSDPLRFNAQGEERANDMAEDGLQDLLRTALAEAGFPQPPGPAPLFEWAELVAYALADEILFTNEHQRDYMLGYCRDQRLAERARSISRVSPHPTLPPEYYRMARAEHDLTGPGVVDIGYFGVFYATRVLTEVTRALAGLPMADRRRVRLHVFTDRAEQVKHEVTRAGLADVVRVRPYLPYLEFLELTTRMDLLLVNDAATSGHHRLNPYLPSKVSDYLGSGTPVWALYEPGSVLSGIETAYRSPVGDVGAAGAVLRSLVRDHARSEDEPST